MNWFPDTLLAVRLLRGAGRREIVRLGATVLGVALAMFAVLLGLTTPLAISSGTDVEAARTPVIADRVVRDVPTLDRVTRSDVAVGGTPWTRVQVSGVTSGSPLPPGVEVWPAPGTTLVSPALAEVLTEHPVLQQALGPLAPGRISRAGLTSPDELFSYTILGPGTPKSAAAATDEEPSRVVGFGGDPGSSGGSGGWFVLEVLLLVVSPSAVFTAMVLSLTAASRMRRGLALTLVGMTPTRAARLYASEMTIVGLAGAVIGVLVHAGVQGRLAESGVLGVTWWPEQGRTGLPVVVCAVVLATIGIRVLSRRSMRRVLARSPGEEQECRRVRSSWLARGALLLGLPAAGYLVAISALGLLRPDTVLPSDAKVFGMLGCLLVLGAAVVLGSPVWVQGAASRGATRSDHPGVVLGLRGAAHRAAVGRRMVAFVAVAVMMAGVSTAFVETLRRSSQGDAERAHISFQVADFSKMPRWAESLPAGDFTLLTSARRGQEVLDVVVGDCPAVLKQAQRVFHRPGPCVDQVQAAAPAPLSEVELRLAGQVVVAPAGVPRTDRVTWAYKFPLAEADWLGALEAGEVTYWVSHRDGSYDEVLGSLVSLFPDATLDAGADNPDQYVDHRTQVGTVRVAVAIGVLLSIGSLVLAALDNRWSRARSVSMLAAVGASRSDLRIANLIEFVLPVAVTLVPAASVALFGGWALVSTEGSNHMFSPVVPVAVGLSSVVCLVVSAAVGWCSGGSRFDPQAVEDF